MEPSWRPGRYADGRRSHMPGRVSRRGRGCRPGAAGYNTLFTETQGLRPERGSMPHTKSAKKHQRQSEKRRLRNRATKKAIKTQLKRFSAALDGPLDKLREEYNLAAKKLDK